MPKTKMADACVNKHQPEASPGKDSAIEPLTLSTASVKHVEIAEVQTPWLDVICSWRADARERRRRIQRMTRSALAAEERKS